MRFFWTHWFFILPNFVEPYQSPKAPSSCLRVGQIFFRCEIWQIFQFTSHDMKECHNWENLILLFKWASSRQRATFIAAIKLWRWEICTLWYCMTTSTQNTTIMVPKFTFKLNPWVYCKHCKIRIFKWWTFGG